MRNLDTVKVILKDDTVTDDFLLLNGFKEVWYEYNGLPMCIRRHYLPLAISRDAVVQMYLEHDGVIRDVGLNWR